MSTEEIPEEYVHRIKNNRKVTSIFVDPLIWQPFKHTCRVRGTSTCSVLEAFMYAFHKAVPATPSSVLPVVNVNLTVQRVVSKPRRVTKEWAGVQKKRMKVRRVDGSFYIVEGYVMEEEDFEELLKE